MDFEFELIINGLSPHFENLGIKFMIIGAKARDLIAKKAGLPQSTRYTSDVDFGILIDSWEILDELRRSFEGDPLVKTSSNKENIVRYYYNDTPFDLVPFGEIARDGKISWPPFYDTILKVTGYQEALNSASEHRIGSQTVKVINAEMLVVLKLGSWDERPERQKDAIDIHYLLTNYEKIDPTAINYVWDHYENLPEKFDHDFSLILVALMGIRIKNQVSESHCTLLKKLLLDDEQKNRLARNMRSRTIAATDDYDFKKAIDLLNALAEGIQYRQA